MLFAVLEFWLLNGLREKYLFAMFTIPQSALDIMFWIGVCMIVVGQAFRTLAEFTAAKSFNHLVQDEKDEKHVLVTNGVYRLVRHPSYFGWMLWAVGT